jgi:hypothetical protein
MIKPLTLVTAPFVLPQLGLAGLGSLALWGGYIRWSQRWEFGRHQFRFLLHQLFIQRMKSPRRVFSPPRPTQRVSRWLRVWRTAQWRWKHLGRASLQALPFYVCPTYLRAWTWKGIVLAGIIILGYGNSKYLLLDLLWLFPVSTSNG